MSNSLKKKKKKNSQMYNQFKIQPNNMTPIQKPTQHHKQYKMKFPNLLVQGEKDH